METITLTPPEKRTDRRVALWRFVRRFFRAQTAHREAVTLATCLCKRHYGGVAMRWEPDEDTTGVVLQISNMTAGLSDQLDHAETILCNALPPPHCTPEEWETIIRGWREIPVKSPAVIDAAMKEEAN